MNMAYLFLKRNRGWPSPDDSWGLTPMFGEDGWCRSCGTPLRDQCGPLIMRRAGLARPEGAWTPNWRFDVLCLGEELASLVGSKFDVEVRPVSWIGKSEPPAWQLVIPTVGSRRFDPVQLGERASARHEVAGESCQSCGIWRWMPVPTSELPQLTQDAAMGGGDVAASPEWFGAGHQSYRKLVFRRGLAELLAEASPKDFMNQDGESGGSIL
jgi:hypothetical protein